MAETMRVADGWWCDEHAEIHVGKLTDWTMEHRAQLHPLYAHKRNLDSSQEVQVSAPKVGA